MTKEAITFVGVGDVIIDREHPETMFRHVKEVFKSADIAYANMEQVLSDKGTPHPRQAVHSSPDIVDAFTKNGVDVFSPAPKYAMPPELRVSKVPNMPSDLQSMI